MGNCLKYHCRTNKNMTSFNVVITHHGFPNIEQEKRVIEAAGGTVQEVHSELPDELIAATREADALLVQHAPITAEVIGSLSNCKIIVRYGIGVDNVDLVAAKEKNIPVCNVPDYGVDEVADHAVSLALALARQLPQINRRFKSGVWKIVPDSPMPAFREMMFATAGFGRIGRAVLERAKSFKFRLAAYDPFVDAEKMAESGVTKLSLDELFSQSDILSLHLPLSPETHHLANATRLRQMKPHAILVNTARGALIDTVALAAALQENIIASAGVDVFEAEPPEGDHPLLACDNALLTSHVAWFSESSVPLLQRLAAEELVRGIRNEPLKNQVNL